MCFVELFFEFVHSFFEGFGLVFGEVDSDLEDLVREPGAPHEGKRDCEREEAPKGVNELAEGKDNECKGCYYPKGESGVEFDFHLLYRFLLYSARTGQIGMLKWKSFTFLQKEYALKSSLM